VVEAKRPESTEEVTIMARRDPFVSSVPGAAKKRGRDERVHRARNAIAWLVAATFVCSAVVSSVIDRRAGSALAVLDETTPSDGRLTTTVLATEDLERDSLGRVYFDGWGALPPRSVPVALRNEISVLSEHRDRVRDRSPLDLLRSPFPDLPIADDVPPRMDSGHPDPDRLLPSSRPAAEDAQ
jgi:hypothetical protein